MCNFLIFLTSDTRKKHVNIHGIRDVNEKVIPIIPIVAGTSIKNPEIIPARTVRFEKHSIELKDLNNKMSDNPFRI